MHQFTSQGHHLTECITTNTVSHRQGKGSIWTDYHLQSWHTALVHTETLNLIWPLHHSSRVHGNLAPSRKRSPPHAMKVRSVIVWLSLYNVTKVKPWLVRVRRSHSWNIGPFQHVTPCINDRTWADALNLQQWKTAVTVRGKELRIPNQSSRRSSAVKGTRQEDLCSLPALGGKKGNKNISISSAPFSSHLAHKHRQVFSSRHWLEKKQAISASI